MKKKYLITAIMLVTMLSIFSLSACKSKEKDEPSNVAISIVAPDGAPSLAVASLISDKKFNVTITPSAQIATEAIKNDFAIVPANMASTLYNKGNQIKLVCSVTNGNLYVVGSKSGATSLADLIGKRVFSIGQGSVPDMIFLSLLDDSKIKHSASETAVEGQVNITYVADGSGVASQILNAKKNNEEVYGMLAEPAVTALLSKGGVQIFDLQQLWQTKVSSATLGYAQAVLICKDTISQDVVDEVISKLEGNKKYVVDNTSEAIKQIKSKYEATTLSPNIASETVKRCNIDIVLASKNKDYFVQTLQAVMNINPKAIGGKMPDDKFYFAK